MLLGVLNKDSILTESLNLGDSWGIEDINKEIPYQLNMAAGLLKLGIRRTI